MMKTSQKRIARIGIISIFMIIGLLVHISAVFAEEQPVATVIYLKGSVEFMASGSDPADAAKAGEAKTASFGRWVDAKKSQPVFLNDKFRTSRKSRVKILFVDKSMIALGPNSEFAVEKYVFNGSEKLRQSVVSVARGMAMYIVNKSQTNKESSFKIVTPTANIAARGTQGYVRVTDEATYVGNEAGAVDTENVVTACASGNLPDGVCVNVE